jgi:hypothetical protein
VLSASGNDLDRRIDALNQPSSLDFFLSQSNSTFNLIGRFAGKVQLGALRCLFPFFGAFLKIYRVVLLKDAFAIELFDLNELHIHWIVGNWEEVSSEGSSSP